MIWLETIYQFFRYLICLRQYKSFGGYENEQQDGLSPIRFVIQTKRKHILETQKGEKGECFQNSKNKTLEGTVEPQFKNKKIK